MNKENKHRITPLKHVGISLLISLTVCIIYMLLYNYRLGKSNMTTSFQEELLRKEQTSNKILNKLTQERAKLNLRNYILSNQSIKREAVRNNITTFIQDTSGVVYWTDHTQDIPFETNAFESENLQFVHFKNSSYVYHSRRYDSLLVVNFILIKDEYISQNQFFEEKFPAEFYVSKHSKVSKRHEANAYPIYDLQGNTIFYFTPDVDSVVNLSNFQIILLGITYFLFILFLILLFNVIHKRYGLNTYLIAVFVVSIGMSILFYLIPKDSLFYSHILFSPRLFAVYWWIPSLGHLLVYTSNLTMLICSLSLVLARSRSTSIFNIYLSHVFNGLIFVTYLFLLSLICHNSSLPIDFKYVSFVDYKIYFYYAIITIASFGVCVNSFYAYSISIKLGEKKLLLLQLSSLIFTFLISYFYFHYPWWTILFHASILVVCQFIVRNIHDETPIPFRFNPRIIIVIVIVQSTFSNFFINTLNKPIIDSYIETKMSNLNETLPNKTNNWEEFLLEDISTQIEIAANTYIQHDELHSTEELKSQILSSFEFPDWEKYKITVSVINDVNEFKNDDHRVGQKVGSSLFYEVIDDGEKNYIGLFNSFDKKLQITVSIINNQISSSNDGYSSVFNTQLIQTGVGKQLSFARYSNGKLELSSGAYSYNSNDMWIKFRQKVNKHAKNYISYNNYEHWIYESGKDQVLIISFPLNSTNTFFIINTFSTVIFSIFVLLLISICLLLKLINTKKSLTTRMSVSFTLIFFLSITFLSTLTLKVSIAQYMENNNDFLNQKSDNVLTFFNQFVETKSDLSVENLSILTNKLSQQFSVDVNIYDFNGKLIISSQPAIFNQGLRSQYMSSSARIELGTEQEQQVLKKEMIGKLTFFSYYGPIYSTENKLIGYFNIPYLYSINKLNLSIYNLLAGIINVYLLLILIMSFFIVLISKKLTQPLIEIQRNIKELQIKNINKPIEYSENDEVGELINEYNKMLRTIENQAIKLAESERETAWRTMARQIAHEIKNPLTPMKLKIQQLQNLRNANTAKFNNYFDLAAPVLIEQINSLASIADEFSDFSKVNKDREYEAMDIIAWIKQYIIIYNSGEDFTIQFEHHPLAEIWSNSDRSQLRQVFNNIVNNAVQARIKENELIVQIKVIILNDVLRISILNNGAMIPEEIQSKIFDPNFTTKSTGMGLGLPICKRIIEHLGGKLWFVSDNQSTTFFIDLKYIKYK